MSPLNTYGSKNKAFMKKTMDKQKSACSKDLFKTTYMTTLASFFSIIGLVYTPTLEDNKSHNGKVSEKKKEMHRNIDLPSEI